MSPALIWNEICTLWVIPFVWFDTHKQFLGCFTGEHTCKNHFYMTAFSQGICHSAGATPAIYTYWCLSSIHILAVLYRCQQTVNTFPDVESSASRLSHLFWNPFLQQVCATGVWQWLVPVLTDLIKLLFSKLIKLRCGCEGWLCG